MERSRRDLFKDMAEPRAILKRNKNTCHSRFSFTPKTGISKLTIHPEFNEHLEKTILVLVFDVFNYYLCTT